MAYSLSPNLKLRIDSNLTANAKYNLLKLDELGSLAATSSASGTVQLKSQYDLFLNANDPDQGGTGRGGNIVMGAPDNQLDTIVMNASRVVVNGGWGFLDQAVAGTTQEASSLTLAYFSNLSGSQDPNEVTLKLDLENQDRSLILGGNLQIAGSVLLNAPAGANLQLPTSGTLATLDGVEVLTNKTLDASRNLLQNISYSSLAPSFQLPGSQVLASFPNQQVLASSLKLGNVQIGPAANSPSLSFQLPSSAGAAGQVLGTDGTGTLSWVSKSDLTIGLSTTSSAFSVSSTKSSSGFTEFSLNPVPQEKNQVWAGPAGGSSAPPSFRRLEYQDVSHLIGLSKSVTWAPQDGASLTIQHNWGTRSVIVQIFDNQAGEGLDGPTVRRVDLNRVQIISQLPPPSGGWTVLLHAVV